MTTTRVKAHERRNPHGGIEHVKEHSRKIDNGTATSENNEVNFEDEEQEEQESEMKAGGKKDNVSA